MYSKELLQKMTKEELIDIILSSGEKLYFFKTLKNKEDIAISIVVENNKKYLKVHWEIKNNIYKNEIEQNGVINIELTITQKENIEKNGFTSHIVYELIKNRCEFQFFPYKDKTSPITYLINSII